MTMRRCEATFILLLWMLSLLASTANAEESASPFVAGFERFGRHEEIDQYTGGRLLISELSCTACHASDSEHLAPKRGPRLSGAGNRIRQAWLKQFLSAPRETKPGTTMPDLFAGWNAEEKAQAIAALAAFLSTQREAFPVLKASGANPVPFEFWKRGDPEQGRRLYHRVGCIACHEAEADYETADTKPSALDQLLEQLNPQELAEMGLSAKVRRVKSVPHPDLAAKYTPLSLTFFLLDPETARPAGRMPSLKLLPVEAADIAAYLLRKQPAGRAEVLPEENESLIQSGRQLFAELRCINCHAVNGLKADDFSKPLAELNTSAEQGCLGKPRPGLPRFALDEKQTAAIHAALKAAADPPKISASGRLRFELLRLNCYACHERGGRGGVGRYRKAYFETVGHIDIGDEGRLPPPLTHAGAKLQKTWLSKVLKGQGDLRPYMRIRMPVFSAAATKILPGLFARADHHARPLSEAEAFGKLEGLAGAGRELLDNGCVQCHPLRGEALPGVVGIDLAGIARRVQPGWFHDFLLDPGDLKKRTRMPTFFPGGKSQNKGVLAGDAERQIAAMWAYLKDLDKQPLPKKIEKARAEDYELRPTGRPLVLRTFMKEAGTHAIAVGFPEQVHFAFDAELVRPAVAWRGKFLDAQGTWFSRFTPPADPLGDDQISLPAGRPLAVLQDSQHPWPRPDPFDSSYRYLGYRLDPAGQPTFLYRYGRFDIEDCIKPAGKQQLKRRLTITNRKPKEPPPPLWFRANVGKTLKSSSERSYTNAAGLTVKISQALGDLGERRRINSQQEWIVPLTVRTKRTIEIQYGW